MQFRANLDEDVHLLETHADFMAGWYLGTKEAVELQACTSTHSPHPSTARASEAATFDPNAYGTPAAGLPP